MTSEELTRAAALVDGGWLTMDEGGPRLTTRLQVSAERLVNVHWLEKTVGGTLGRKHGLYWWNYGGKRAVVFLKSIESLLDMRMGEAMAVIEASQAEAERRTQLIDWLFEMNMARAGQLPREQWPWMFQVAREEWKAKRIARENGEKR